MFGNIGLVTFLGLSLTIYGFIVDDRLQTTADAKIPCNINRAGSCPSDMCCVRDESDFNHTVCKKLGKDGDLCANYTSQFICPCKNDMVCKQNPSDPFSTCKPEKKIPCNISTTHNTCPSGYCCVHDDLLYTFTHCKRYGEHNDTCLTKPTDLDCPCKDGLVCRSNTGTLYGTCHPTSDRPVG